MNEILEDHLPYSDRLDLYQTELAVQNQELRSSRQLLEDTLDLYANLYDFAVVGCFTLDARGCVTDMNLTAAAFLGTGRDQIIGKPLARWLDPASVPVFFATVKRCVKDNLRTSSRLRLVKDVINKDLLLIAAPARPLEDGGRPLISCAFIPEFDFLNGASFRA